MDPIDEENTVKFGIILKKSISPFITIPVEINKISNTLIFKIPIKVTNS